MQQAQRAAGETDEQKLHFADLTEAYSHIDLVRIIQKGQWDGDFSRAEQAAIGLYAYGEFYAGNKKLRAGTVLDDDQQLILKGLDGAMAKKIDEIYTDKASGIDKTFRGGFAPSSAYEGEVVSDAGFLSTSARKEIADTFMSRDGRNIFQVLFGYSGLKVSSGYFANEKEVLYGRNTPFDVLLSGLEQADRRFVVLSEAALPPIAGQRYQMDLISGAGSSFKYKPREAIQLGRQNSTPAHVVLNGTDAPPPPVTSKPAVREQSREPASVSQAHGNYVPLPPVASAGKPRASASVSKKPSVSSQGPASAKGIKPLLPPIASAAKDGGLLGDLLTVKKLATPAKPVDWPIKKVPLPPLSGSGKKKEAPQHP